MGDERCFAIRINGKIITGKLYLSEVDAANAVADALSNCMYGRYMTEGDLHFEVIEVVVTERDSSKDHPTLPLGVRSPDAAFAKGVV